MLSCNAMLVLSFLLCFVLFTLRRFGGNYYMSWRCVRVFYFFIFSNEGRVIPAHWSFILTTKSDSIFVTVGVFCPLILCYSLYFGDGMIVLHYILVLFNLLFSIFMHFNVRHFRSRSVKLI